MGLIKKLFAVGLSKLSPSVKSFFQTQLTRLLDFLEKHFNNVIKHLFAMGGAGLAIGEIVNISTTIQDGALEKFGFFSRMLGIQAIFNGVNNILTPYMLHSWNCTWLQFMSAFGAVDAINTIINSCAYALLFWLAVVVFKYTIGLIPVILRLLGKV